VEGLGNLFETTRGVEVDILTQEEATSQNLIFNHLEDNYYDIIHYAGHTSFNEQNPEQSQIHLNDTAITAQYLLNLLNTPPRLMFLNSCSSSTSGGVEYWEQEGQVSGLASSVISAGVDQYIGAMWPVSDRVSQQLSRTFYEQLFNGAAVGHALQTARNRIIESSQESLSAASFILYGDPRAASAQTNSVPKQKRLTETSYESSRDLCSKIGIGSVDIGFLGLNQTLYRMHQGLDVRIIGISAYSEGGIGIIASSDTDIETVEDLAGRQIAVAPNRESTANRWLKDVLRGADIDPRSVSKIEMNGTDHYRHIRETKIDAVATWDPWKSLAERVGRLITDDSYADERSYEVIVASEQFLESDRDKLESVLNTHFHVIDEIENLEEYPDTYANRLGIDSSAVGMQQDGYVRPTRTEHLAEHLESDLRATVERELEFLEEEGFVRDTDFDADHIDFSVIPEESPPETIELDSIRVGHQDSLACISAVERGYYV